MNYEPMMSKKTSGFEPYSGDDGERVAPQRRAILVGVALALLIAAGVLIYKFTRPAPPPPSAPTLPNVTVMTAGRTMIDRVVTATGSLAAKREMPIGVVGEGGMVTQVLVEPGDWVKPGQVLVTIEHSVQSAQVQSSASQIAVAEANARIAENELERAKALVARGFISKADVDRKTATRDAARAQVNVARAQLGETAARARRLDIRAPAAGLILTRAVEPGQVVGAGSAVLFRLARGGEMELRAQIAEADLAQIKVGAHADVTPVGTQASFGGPVWQLSPVIDPQTRLGTVRIALAYNSALRPGGFATAKLAIGTIDAPLLPESAVQSADSGSTVLIIDRDNKVVKRAVVVGDVSDAGIAIKSGLDGSERVVVSAAAFLNPGEKVQPTLAKQGQ